MFLSFQSVLVLYSFNVQQLKTFIVTLSVFVPSIYHSTFFLISAPRILRRDVCSNLGTYMINFFKWWFVAKFTKFGEISSIITNFTDDVLRWTYIQVALSKRVAAFHAWFTPFYVESWFFPYLVLYIKRFKSRPSKQISRQILAIIF